MSDGEAAPPGLAGSENPTNRCRNIVSLVGNMLEERIQSTESAVKTDENISADQKAELLDLLARLKSALGKVEHREDAESIARFAEASLREATRKRKKPNVLEAALHGLKQSVEEFEASHPELVALVTEFATVLANMGL